MDRHPEELHVKPQQNKQIFYAWACSLDSALKLIIFSPSWTLMLFVSNGYLYRYRCSKNVWEFSGSVNVYAKKKAMIWRVYVTWWRQAKF